ncbi:MAG: hypothetical protein LQ340_000931 [Diploschistes diacapsis]|nr:MAG: hypothetical protein LQ340_000931 [Diploschistes diacapsis]
MHLDPFAADLGPDALYALTGFEAYNEDDKTAAAEICYLFERFLTTSAAGLSDERLEFLDDEFE